MMGAALQEQNEVPDDKMSLRIEPWSSKAHRPLPKPAHPCARDILLRSLEVEVKCHRTKRHKLGDKGFNVLDPRRCCGE